MGSDDLCVMHSNHFNALSMISGFLFADSSFTCVRGSYGTAINMHHTFEKRVVPTERIYLVYSRGHTSLLVIIRGDQL